MRAAVEVGWTTFIFTPDTKYMAPQWTCKWQKSVHYLKIYLVDFEVGLVVDILLLIGCVCAAIEWIKPLFLEGGRFLNQEGKQVALLGQVYSGEQLDYLPAMMGGTEIVVINDLDWQVISCKY